MPHYFSRKQEAEQNIKKIKIDILNRSFNFILSSAVFSRSRLDKGSEVLIKHAEIENGEKIHDLGCGWGAVGIVLGKVYNCEVSASDVNERALDLTKRNAKLNKVEVNVKYSDGFEKIKEKFDVILLNPPQSAGRKVCYKLIEESFNHLNEEGSLQIVARHKKGGETLSNFMEELFGNVETVARKSGYRVYRSVRE